jgi:trk system potassium uptake protein TrkH
MKTASIIIQPIVSVIGIFLLWLSFAMLIPGLLDFFEGNQNWVGFFVSSVFTFFMGMSFILMNRGSSIKIEVKSAFMLVVLSWFSLSIFASLPFITSTQNFSLTDAFFESVSGLTTTGSTIINDIENSSRGIILWRAILQWLGGIGIIVSAISILPRLGVGGMQLFRLESSDTSEKILPKAARIAAEISVLYITLSVICSIAFIFSGLSFFDSVVHAMSTIATGGFSSKSGSIGSYNSVNLETVTILFMILASLPFVLYLKAIRGKPKDLIKDQQVQGFFKTLLISILIVVFYLTLTSNFTFSEILRYSIFNVTSILTGTGFTSTNYNGWGTPIILLFLFITFIGGCAGSTTCGVKIFRLQIVFNNSKEMISKLISPNRVVNKRYNGEHLSPEVTQSVITFLFIFILTFIVLSILLSFTGLDLLTSFSAAATSISNVGPGLGQVIGPAYSFSQIPEIAKWLLSFGMLAGRLEFLTLIVIFNKSFWR